MSREASKPRVFEVCAEGSSRAGNIHERYVNVRRPQVLYTGPKGRSITVY